MLKIVAAQRVRCEDTTDIREEEGPPCGEATLVYLNEKLEGGALELTPGLMGWGDYTHTARGNVATFHVRLEAVPVRTPFRFCDGSRVLCNGRLTGDPLRGVVVRRYESVPHGNCYDVNLDEGGRLAGVMEDWLEKVTLG